MLRLLLKMCLLGISSLLLLFALTEGWTAWSAYGKHSSDPAACPSPSVGLVLGCNRWVGTGRENLYFRGRINKAAEFWKTGRASHIIVSGDNSSIYYNEPEMMRKQLVKLGVPDEYIISDYAGLRTYDSVLRANKIFGADRLTIISQPFHVRRALAIAQFHGIDAYGLEAPLGPLNYRSLLRSFIRERLARVAMLLDLVSNGEPTHMGAPQPIEHQDAPSTKNL